MKNMYKAFGIIIMAVIIVLLAVGCGGTGNGNPGTDNIAPPTSGKLTITGLEDYNGAYIIAEGYVGYNPEKYLYAGGGMNFSEWTFIGTRISNGQATLNVWEGVFEEVYDEYDDEYYDDWTGLKSYSGNDQNVGFYVMIFNGSTFSSGGSNEAADGQVYPVNFSNGSATVAISNIVPVVKVNLGNGIEGSLSAYDGGYGGYIDIYFYGHAIAKDGYSKDYEQDFELYVDGELMPFSHTLSLFIDDEGFIGFNYYNTDLLTVGESTNIRVKYTANVARPIKVWIPKNDDDWYVPPANAATLGSFDTGVKTVIVKEDY